ncbi:hypothetical protein LUZ60_007762 [Juncus effusus]|nr:hypothetical protein LUZ60_007762 [Juncus effusus]
MESFKSKNLISGLIILSLLSQVVTAAALESSNDQSGGDSGPIDAFQPGPKINCDFACARRCGKASRTNVCIRACGSCCLKCQCVPTGTSGNQEMCPCYANLRTHGLKPKCP